MKQDAPKLIFVYNADSGLFNLLSDIGHKIFSPETYNCSLCALTHGNFGMKREWRDYLKTLPIEFEFMHADEFRAKYKCETSEKLSAVFILENNSTVLIIDAERINACRSIKDLKQIINTYLENRKRNNKMNT